MKGTITALMLMMTCGVAVAADFPEPLPAETVPNVLALPESYPKTWIFAHDANFFSLVDGKVVILDVAAQTRQYKGQIGAGQFATFLQATTRPELYVAETFYSRRIRGERTDAITIYDTASLQFKDEIILPGGKRGQSVTQKNSFRFTDGERLGLIFNFTPAASVTIVDLPARAVLNEIQIPGCSLIYPTGQRGFSTLCGNGKMVSFVLDEAGREAGRYETEAFNDIDGDPLFMKAARIGGVSYFVSFKGRVQPVDLSGARAKVKKAWSLVDDGEAAANWRPAGWQVLTADAAGQLYVLMQKGGYEGSHKDGGSEIWVFDVRKKKRVQRIALASPGISIEATKGDTPYLVVVNADMAFDVYDPASGDLIRTIGGRAAETPFVLHAVE